ncbi:UNVERIFIED_CONTAM: hypothetical protein Slati_4291500 [Sesamum latifolium]|uniref:Uncharacterized protein n=1 Tax=Sesamum latifolium TaxID=2727402 RepID=A0AAW2TGG9_9LAMI
MFRIVSKLRLCGEDVTDEQMLKKTFSTFHASNLVLQQQYRKPNATSSRKGRGRYHGSPWGHSYGRGRGHSGRGRSRVNDRENHHNTWINPNIQKNNGNKAKNQQEKTTKRDLFHNCGMSGHWSLTCHTAQHLVKLYQASVKAKAKEVVTNFVEAEISDNTHIDASDFFQSIENNDKDLPELPLQFGDLPEDFNMLVD